MATSGPPTPAPVRHTYGPDPSQYGDLYRPAAVRHHGIVVIVHGGFWLSQYDATLGAPLAADLAADGWTAWNLEYRRVGDGGGWPATLQDVSDGIDAVAGLSVDTAKVVVIGHSAGGQLGVWSAGRARLPAGAPGANPRVAVTGVISQAGVLDLVGAADNGVGGSAVSDFLGGGPDAEPDRYSIASPLSRLPLSVPVRCVHARADQNVPFDQSQIYVAQATKDGDDATLTEVPGDHFTLIDVTAPAWQAAKTLLETLTG